GVSAFRCERTHEPSAARRQTRRFRDPPRYSAGKLPALPPGCRTSSSAHRSDCSEYHVDEPPRLVLDKLDKIGFRVVSMTGVGQTLVWCLYKETSNTL
uniref:GTP cyclohydrolase 1 feedback regulatory protein n=1 Tax=Cyprinus carpio carpio TaxID=630221 RepID=A0A8C0Y7I6_CYPCA